jgi:hypothetical protein
MGQHLYLIRIGLAPPVEIVGLKAHTQQKEGVGVGVQHRL